MSLTFQHLLSDAKTLVKRLKDYDSKTDELMARTQTLNKSVESMKEYHEDMCTMSGLNKSQPRNAIIVTIQRESKQLKKLELENRELKCALEDYQIVLELIMSKYRHQTSQLIKVDREERDCHHSHTDHSKEIINHLTNKICEMMSVMKEAVHIDESNAHKEQELMARLKLENKTLRELLIKVPNYIRLTNAENGSDD